MIYDSFFLVFRVNKNYGNVATLGKSQVFFQKIMGQDVDFYRYHMLRY